MCGGACGSRLHIYRTLTDLIIIVPSDREYRCSRVGSRRALSAHVGCLLFPMSHTHTRAPLPIREQDEGFSVRVSAAPRTRERSIALQSRDDVIRTTNVNVHAARTRATRAKKSFLPCRKCEMVNDVCARRRLCTCTHTHIQHL